MASLQENVERAITAFQNIKKTIINCGAYVEGDIPVEEYPNKIGDVFDTGIEIGIKVGISEGYDEFWDIFQNYGNLRNYSYTFSGIGWTSENFKPKYNIIITSGSRTFYCCGVSNIKESLQKRGIALQIDLDDMAYMFYHAETLELPEIKARRTLNSTFRACPSLKTVDKLVLNCNETTTTDFSNAFFGCSSLENITIEGEILAGGLSFAQSEALSKESITSVINALSATTEGLTIGLSSVAVNNAFGIDVEDETTYTDEWINLINSKSNWTIVY